MSDRHKTMLRTYHMISLLQNSHYGLTAKQLWDQLKEQGFDCEIRTVYRDIDFLQQADFPLIELKDEDSSKQSGSKWRLESHTKITENFALSPKELFALYLARGVLSPLQNTPFYQDLQTIFSKIEARIPERARAHFNELSSQLHFDPLPKWGLGINPDVIDTVHAATLEKHILKTIYASANSQDKRERRIGPHFIYFAKGSVYLVAEDLEDSVVKVWSIARMSEAVMTEDAYDKDTIDPNDYFKSAFGIFSGGIAQKVKLEFASTIAPYIKERGWHPTQKMISKEDGSLVFEMEVSLSPEVVQWVLGFGANVRVLEPSALKQKLLEASSAVLKLYELKKGEVA